VGWFPVGKAGPAPATLHRAMGRRASVGPVASVHAAVPVGQGEAGRPGDGYTWGAAAGVRA
jgi:hypothetical protein